MDVCCGGHGKEIEIIGESGSIIKEIDFILDSLRIPVTKALNPLKQRDFVRMEARIAKKLIKAFKSASAEDSAEIAELIKGVDLKSPETIERFVKQAKASLKGLERGVAKEVAPVLEVAIEDMYKSTKIAQTNALFDSNRIADKAIGAFGGRDEEVIDLLQKHQRVYIKEGFRQSIDKFDGRAKKILSEGLERGQSQKVVAKNLEKAFGSSVGSKSYWHVVANAWMNRTRNWSNLETMKAGGFDKYEVIAVMDERTSSICRFMNGKTFKVEKQIEMMEQASEQDDLDSFTSVTPWLSTRKKGEDVAIGVVKPSGRFVAFERNGEELKGNRAIQNAGVALPPYHGMCRTTVGVV